MSAWGQHAHAFRARCFGMQILIGMESLAQSLLLQHALGGSGGWAFLRGFVRAVSGKLLPLRCLQRGNLMSQERGKVLARLAA